MISCCTNERAVGYSDYGGRGVRVCEAWLNSFQSFLDDAGECPGPDHTLNLKDGEGNFKPDNVEWTNHGLEAGEDWGYEYLDLERIRLDLKDWAKLFGFPPSIIAYAAMRELPRYNTPH